MSTDITTYLQLIKYKRVYPLYDVDEKQFEVLAKNFVEVIMNDTQAVRLHDRAELYVEIREGEFSILRCRILGFWMKVWSCVDKNVINQT